VFTANIHNELRNFCGSRMRNRQTSFAEVAADTTSWKTTWVGEVQRAIEEYMRGVERSEEYFRPIGRKLSHATHCGIASTTTVNALFQLLPRLVEPARPAWSTMSADKSDKNIKDLHSGHAGAILILPATWLYPAGASRGPVSTGKVKCQAIFQSAVLPFWRSGRWHVAVLRSAENTVVIDPWGLNTSTDLDVGLVVRSVVRAFILTPKLTGHSFVTS